MGPPGASPWSVPGSDFSKRRTQGRKYGKLLHDLENLLGVTYLFGSDTPLDFQQLVTCCEVSCWENDTRNIQKLLNGLEAGQGNHIHLAEMHESPSSKSPVFFVVMLGCSQIVADMWGSGRHGDASN